MIVAKHGLILKTYSVKQAIHKGAHAVEIYKYEVVKQAKLICESKKSGSSCLLLRDRPGCRKTSGGMGSIKKYF